jgi:hypothetical protein
MLARASLLALLLVVFVALFATPTDAIPLNHIRGRMEGCLYKEGYEWCPILERCIQTGVEACVEDPRRRR